MIQSPNTIPAPKWAADLVRAANARNRARNCGDTFTIEDLKVLWVECGGRCSVSRLPFSLVVVGDGQAKRPFAPSLDRKDRHQPYTLNNVRLVTSVTNFAMNAWGLDPVLVLAAAMHKAHCDRPPVGNGPGDAELTNEAVTDGERVITENGASSFPARTDVMEAVLAILRGGTSSSREMEDLLAERFHLNEEDRRLKHPNGMPVWRNFLAFASKDLVETQKIQRVDERHNPDGGTTGVYQLRGSERAVSGG
jgi:hypothetical protein